jgi:hypothetical protein
MDKLKLLVCTMVLVIPGITIAQNNTNSPYTRYGYGNLADKSFAPQRAMGGIGYGLRNPQMINSMNPASYSGLDSLTFMFELGLTGQYAWFEDSMNKVRKINGNLEYLALQFSLMKNMGIGVGIEPVSYVGYTYGDTAHLKEGEEVASRIYQGQGGMSRVYASLSYDFFDRLSLGVKFAYLYGDIAHYKEAYFGISDSYNITWTDTLRTTGLTYDFGLQYHQPIGKDKTLVIGAVYTPKTILNGNIRTGELRMNNAGSQLVSGQYYATNDSVFELPETYGLGFTYNRMNKLTVGADFLYEKWADAKFYDITNALNNRMKINAGVEFIPNLMTNKYFNRVRYRAGLNYSDSYIKIDDKDGTGYKEYGLSIGAGFPMIDRRSFVNVALGYSVLQPEIKTYIKEQYFKFTLSYTFNELWFFKQKLK